MSKKQILQLAFTKSIPVMCSYIFLSIAYGLMMQNAGLGWFYSLFASAFVYTGAFQFVLITFLSTGASLATVLLTALLMNSRQIFYAITFLPEFKKTGKRLPYMIHSLTDETFAVNCTLTLTGREKRDTMFVLALLCQGYWIIGSVIGSILGQLIPFELEGIDFCMTALFLIIFTDQWEKAQAAMKEKEQQVHSSPQCSRAGSHFSDLLDAHFPALLGLALGLVCLLLFGSDRFMLPALLITSGILLLWQQRVHA